MKRTVFALGFALVAANSAAAADLIIDGPAITSPTSVFEWSGFYLGAVGGFSFADADVEISPSPGPFFGACIAAESCLTDFSTELNGFSGGLQAGADMQVDNFVFGVVADLSLGGPSGDSAATTTAGLFDRFDYVGTSSYGWFGTLRGRAGLAFDQLLVYGTAGLAIASVEDTVSWGYPTRIPSTNYYAESTSTLAGGVFGAGASVAVTDQIVINGEVLLYQLGSQEFELEADFDDGPEFVNASIAHGGAIARASVLFKF